MRRSHRNTVIVILITLLFIFPIFSQQLDYKQIFGDHYKSAEDFLISNKWIADSLKSSGIDPCTGLAVIFPELIRFSSIRDIIETAALQSLYIQYGNYYADFSIGHFQMKPSFAEEMEKEYSRWKGWLMPEIDTMNSSDARKERIKRLRSDEGQVRYLCMFILLMKRRLHQFDVIEKDEEVRLLSAAYNHGFRADFESLKVMSRKRFFYTGIIPPESKYNYSDIAAEFCLRYCGM